MLTVIRFIAAVVITAAVVPGTAVALGEYVPLAKWQDTRLKSFNDWNSIRTIFESPLADGRRPVLPGVSGRNLELLQDAIARKFSSRTGKSLVTARRILAQARERNIGTLRGHMAEALFLDLHGEYGYIAKPNASQHDVYAKNPSGGPGIHTGQIKFHMDGNPATYAEDMLHDYRSKDFFVPDDHVESLKSFLRAEGERLLREGKVEEAQAAFRNANRAKPIGATSAQIDAATRQAIAEAKLIRVAPFISLGVVSALALAPIAMDWYEGEMSTHNMLYRGGKSATLIMAGAVSDQTLNLLKGGLLRGTVKGNVIVAVVVLTVDTAWSTYEYGGIRAALGHPEFVMQVCGGVSAVGCGIIGGYAGAMAGGAIGSVFGPVGTTVGGAVGTVTVGGITSFAAYFGGSKGSRWVLEEFAPEYLFQEEQRTTDQLIASLQNYIEQQQMI